MYEFKILLNILTTRMTSLLEKITLKSSLIKVFKRFAQLLYMHFNYICVYQSPVIMLPYKKNKYLSSFRIVVLFTIFFSLFFLFLGVVRFFKIDFFLNFLPKNTREVLYESTIWTNYIYLIIVITHLVENILLLKKKRLTVVV